MERILELSEKSKSFLIKRDKNLRKLKIVLNLHSLNGNGIGLWCNGNTTVFGAVFQGSSPCRPTKNLSIIERFFYAKSSSMTFLFF
jgi:hypothetical protein